MIQISVLVSVKNNEVSIFFIKGSVIEFSLEGGGRYFRDKILPGLDCLTRGGGGGGGVVCHLVHLSRYTCNH